MRGLGLRSRVYDVKKINKKNKERKREREETRHNSQKYINSLPTGIRN